MFTNNTIYGLLVCFMLFINTSKAQESDVESKNSIKTEKDSISTDSLAKEKESLEDILNYASDNQSHDLISRKSYLIKNAKVKYLNYQVDSDYIEIDWKENTIYARGKRDSTGKTTVPTIFKEGQKTYEYNSMKFNFKTKEGKAYNARLVEGENLVYAKEAKRKNDSISFLKNSIYTTDTYYLSKKDSIPDYHVFISKIKYLDKKQIIAGPVQFYIEQVPTPIALPFFTFPISDKRAAGILIPTFGETQSTGFFLRGLGFYMPIKEIADIKLTTDLFSRGSFGFHSEFRYKKRYKFDGTQSFDFENNINGTKGLSNYSKNTIFRLNWSHRQDQKANPYLVFSSNVNISSTNYFSGTINNLNIVNQNILTNTTSSSINLTKSFSNFPVTINLGLNHSQNNQTKEVSLTLPQLGITLARQYPFVKKGMPKKGLLKNFGIDYNLDTKNIVTIQDSLLFKKEMYDRMQRGVRQNANLNTGTTIFRYFPLNFSVNYNETTYFEKFQRTFNSSLNKVDTISNSGLSSFRTFSSSANISTTLFGMLKFKKGKIQAVRHMLIPRVGVSYAPDFSENFWGYFGVYTDGSGNEVSYPKFEGIYGSPGSSESKSLSFGIDNTLEMKVKSKTDSIGSEYRKLKILERLNLSTAYNATAKSFNWSNISFNGATSLFKEQLRINFGGTINPYQFDEVSKTFVDNFGSFKVTNYNITGSFNLTPEIFKKPQKDKPKSPYTKKGVIRFEAYEFDDENYAKFAMKWNLTIGVNHNVTFNQSQNSNINTSSLQFSGGWTPTPYWNINVSTGYDLVDKDITFTSIGFKRDLRSFEIAFNWVPISTRTTWDFLINIKATVLKDTLKYNDQNFDFQNQIR